ILGQRCREPWQNLDRHVGEVVRRLRERARFAHLVYSVDSVAAAPLRYVEGVVENREPAEVVVLSSLIRRVMCASRGSRVHHLGDREVPDLSWRPGRLAWDYQLYPGGRDDVLRSSAAVIGIACR